MFRRKCDHDYDCTLRLPDYKDIEGTFVITGMGVLTSVCAKCGHVKEEMVSGGYFKLQEDEE